MHMLWFLLFVLPIKLFFQYKSYVWLNEGMIPISNMSRFFSVFSMLYLLLLKSFMIRILYDILMLFCVLSQRREILYTLVM